MKTIKNLKAEEIRKSILQLAIQGKLVKQDPNDEPASELVKRIYAEKQKLIKEGKIKKDKIESYIFKGDDNCYYEKIGKNESIKLDDLPFDIPDNWTWIRLKNCVNIQTGKKDANFGSDIGLYDFFTCALIPIKSNSFSYDGEYIILPGNGANVGKSIHYFGQFEAYQRTYLINKLYHLFNFYYLKLVLDALWYDWNKDKLYGSAIPYIKLANLEEFIIPLPPLEEQQRIVTKINLFEPLIADYAKAEEKLTKLEQEFPDKLKKSILQYAIEGKLVKQDPNDEPASVLLERIKAEKEKLIKEGKIKRDKNESYIYQGDDKNYYENLNGNNVLCDDIVGFSIPSNWSFCHIGNISSYGNTILKRKICINDWLLELEDIESSSSRLISKKFVTEKTNLNSKVSFNNGMILYSKLRPYLDKVLIAKEDGVATSEIVPFWSLINPKYLVLYLKSPYFLKRIINLMYGVKMPRLGTNDMNSIIISVPPLLEQQRIIDKFDKINQLI